MKLSIPKTYILTNSTYPVSWEVDVATLEEVLAAKYLSVSITVRGRHFLAIYEAQMLARACSYAYTIMNLTWKGLDRAVIARAILESCAIPSILYCTKAMAISKSTLRELDQIQNMVGRFIFQVPSATPESWPGLMLGLSLWRTGLNSVKLCTSSPPIRVSTIRLCSPSFCTNLSTLWTNGPSPGWKFRTTLV